LSFADIRIPNGGKRTHSPSQATSNQRTKLNKSTTPVPSLHFAGGPLNESAGFLAE